MLKWKLKIETVLLEHLERYGAQRHVEWLCISRL